MKNKYKIITFVVATIMCLIVIFLYLLSHYETHKIYLDQIEKTIISLKKEFLKSKIDNIFLEIDRFREIKYDNYKRITESRLRRFQEEIYLSDDEYIRFLKNKFNQDIDPRIWTAFLWDNKTGEILFDTTELHIETIDCAVENLKYLLSSYAMIEKGNIEGIFGVSKSYVDETIKEEMGDIIRNQDFSNASYVWVNEVINYEGGKNYAIRRIHPNLRDTEGSYLSTDMEDIKGNFPYLEELDGVKKDGELFFTYYFKKLNSSQISEKLTYAKLYKDYDWIIAMGVHLDDIYAYTEKANNEMNFLYSKSIKELLIYIFVVLLVGFTALYLIEKKNLAISTKYLEKEINLDSLTKASSRRYGEISLDALFKQFKLTGEKPAIMIFDIDDFKHINDKYGHKVGDIVLKEIANSIHSIIRCSDELIRWGGDEFVGIFPGLRKENIIEFGEKLLDEISSLDVPIGNENISITISIGFSYFKNTDNDYSDVLKRADDAMYKSKDQGKKRVNIL